jgi:hypothetical protein
MQKFQGRIGNLTLNVKPKPIQLLELQNLYPCLINLNFKAVIAEAINIQVNFIVALNYPIS